VTRHRQRNGRSEVCPWLAVKSTWQVARELGLDHSTVLRTEARALAKLRKHPLIGKFFEQRALELKGAHFQN
jgi:hypothetical protein